MKEQDDFYRVMFEKVGDKHWFHGFMLWDWPAKLYEPGEVADNRDYCVYLKPAERTIREFYERK